MYKRVQFNYAFVFIAVATILSFATGAVVYGEQSGGSAESGSTSNLKSLYNTLQSAGYGTDTNIPNWGTYWNRISTASQWVPSGNASVSDVALGKTFYNNSRILQTGNGAGTHGVCSTQLYNDSHNSATQTDNCTANITWTSPTDGITGTDKQDPKTALIWSQPLVNSSGTVAYTTGSGDVWSWDASGNNNVAVGNKTASQLCSERGNGWRLPSQKELMHAYIDGSNFNLVQPTFYWSVTQNSATNTWSVDISDGYTRWYVNTDLYDVRCVR